VRLLDHAYAGLVARERVQDCARPIGRTVVHHNEFPFGQRLRSHARNRARDRRDGVARGQHDGNEGQGDGGTATRAKAARRAVSTRVQFIRGVFCGFGGCISARLPGRFGMSATHGAAHRIEEKFSLPLF